MKKLFLFAMLLLFSVSASANAGKRVAAESNNKQVGTVIGKTVVYIYFDNEMEELKDQDSIDLATEIAAKSICTTSQTRDIIEAGYTVLYIYPTKDHAYTTFVQVDNCSKYPQDTKKK